MLETKAEVKVEKEGYYTSNNDSNSWFGKNCEKLTDSGYVLKIKQAGFG